MKNWYQRVILPRLLRSVMKAKDFEVIRREVLAEASGVVLEIGVGPGYNLPLYKNISKLYALEPSKGLIKLAEAKVTSLPFPVEFLNTGAEDIPLADESVDTVVSTWTLCSVTDLEKTLAEVKRVLKPQGKFVFADHGASPRAGVKAAQRAFTVLSKRLSGNCHHDRELEQAIKNAGFTIQKMTHPKNRFKFLVYYYQGVAIKS